MRVGAAMIESLACPCTNPWCTHTIVGILSSSYAVWSTRLNDCRSSIVDPEWEMRIMRSNVFPMNWYDSNNFRTKSKRITADQIPALLMKSNPLSGAYVHALGLCGTMRSGLARCTACSRCDFCKSTFCHCSPFVLMIFPLLPGIL